MRILRSITIRKASSRRSLMSLCYKTISSCCSCAYVEILSTWEVWRALKRLELHSAAPRATLTPLSCSPNFPRAQYLDIRTLMHELIVNYNSLSIFFFWVFEELPHYNSYYTFFTARRELTFIDYDFLRGTRNMRFTLSSPSKVASTYPSRQSVESKNSLILELLLLKVKNCSLL